MESYTKKVMGDYYDSLDMDSEVMDKLQELKTERNLESENKNKFYYKKDRLANVKRQLNYFSERLDDDSDDDYREWVEEQLEKTNEFLGKLAEEERKSVVKIDELAKKIEEIEDKIKNEGLVFYDKEMNVPMDR